MPPKDCFKDFLDELEQKEVGIWGEKGKWKTTVNDDCLFLTREKGEMRIIPFGSIREIRRESGKAWFVLVEAYRKW